VSGSFRLCCGEIPNWVDKVQLIDRIAGQLPIWGNPPVLDILILFNIMSDALTQVLTGDKTIVEHLQYVTPPNCVDCEHVVPGKYEGCTPKCSQIMYEGDIAYVTVARLPSCNNTRCGPEGSLFQRKAREVGNYQFESDPPPLEGWK